VSVFSYQLPLGRSGSEEGTEELVYLKDTAHGVKDLNGTDRRTGQMFAECPLLATDN
jgi:hypothetical protein